jgi:hypothetical protein
MTNRAPHDRLAISFWIWALWDTGTTGFSMTLTCA